MSATESEIAWFEKNVVGVESRDVWICPDCLRTVSVAYPTTWMPNTICSCRFPHHITQMVKISDKVNHRSSVRD